MSDFAMFSKEGDAVCASLVNLAKTTGLNWEQTYAIMRMISENELYSEIMDTSVRECIYDACGFESAFYL